MEPTHVLRNSCFKLRGLAYLIEQCGDHPISPPYEADAFYGVSLILNGIHDEVYAVAHAVDEAEVQAAPQAESGKRVVRSGKKDFRALSRTNPQLIWQARRSNRVPCN